MTEKAAPLAQRRIEEAEKRLATARRQLSRAYERRVNAIAAISNKLSAEINKATDSVHQAASELARAKLVARGIVPKRTVILWHPNGYTSDDFLRRYVAVVSPTGRIALLAINKRGDMIPNRRPIYPVGREWDYIIVTSETVGGEEKRGEEC